VRHRTVVVALCLAMGLAGFGCSTRMASWTAISTRNVQLDKVDLDKLPATRNVSGRDMRWMVLVVPLGVPRIEGAVEDALEKADGDLMLDAVLYSEGWYFLIGRFGWRVQGTVVKTRSTSASPSAPPAK